MKKSVLWEASQKISSDGSSRLNVHEAALMDLTQHFLLKANMLPSEKESWLLQERKEHTAV